MTPTNPLALSVVHPASFAVLLTFLAAAPTAAPAIERPAASAALKSSP